MNAVDSVSFSADLHNAIIQSAEIAGLEPGKFGDEHWEVVARIAAFLQRPVSAEPAANGLTRFLPKRFQPAQASVTVPPAPVIICGEPGTGKTTFISVIDIVLRTKFGLPDLVTRQMQKHDGRVQSVQKRVLAGAPLSLLSVRKWADLLHFYSWDVARHRFDDDDLGDFIRTTLLPMRVIFADEVEMVGYSPTLPELARHGLLVVGTSNQTRFAQLEDELVAPHVIAFGGKDMRAGNPTDALVAPRSAGWRLFEQLRQRKGYSYEGLAYVSAEISEAVYAYVDFPAAVRAPLLESEWVEFFQETYRRAGFYYEPLRVESAYVLLMDNFDLHSLTQDFNTIIRFVALFDAIEQLGLGVLVRNTNVAPELDRTAFARLKTAIETSSDVSQEVKTKVIVGIDRLVSRLGQAGHRAKRWL